MTDRSAARQHGFFDSHSELVDSTGAKKLRLNARHRRLIEPIGARLRGKRVLDLGAHNGRWTLAALAAGASHVTAIEGRGDLARCGQQYLGKCDISPDRYTWRIGDCLTEMREAPIVCDTVLLLGLFYHLHCHVDLAREIARTGAGTILVDTLVAPSEAPVVLYLIETTGSHRNTPYANTATGKALVGIPSSAFVRLVFEAQGYSVERLDWSAELAGGVPRELRDYGNATRASFLCTRD